MPAGLTRIGRRVFKGCTSLKSLILPVSVKNIGFDAFAGCTSLARIAIPKGTCELEDDDVFTNCDSLSDISFGGSREEWEMLTHGKTLMIECTNGAVKTPRVTFLNIDEKKLLKE